MYMASSGCPDADKPICNGTNGKLGVTCCPPNILSQGCPDADKPTCNGTNGKLGVSCCPPNVLS